MRVESLAADVTRRFEVPLLGLKGARGMYATGKPVERSDFRAYVNSRDPSVEFPGVRGFGFIQRVQRADLAAFIAAERADGAPDFNVLTSGEAPDLFVIKLIEPLTDNLAAHGFDVGSEAVRRRAFEQAMLTGEPTLTGRITLLQDGLKRPGFLYYLPVFRAGTDPATPAQRQAALQGMLYMPLVVEELMTGVDQVTQGQATFDLFDGPADSAEQKLFALHGTGATPTQQAPAAALMAPHLSTSKTVTVGGRALTLRIQSAPEFEASSNRTGVVWLAVASTVMSFTVAFVVWLLGSGRARAVALAASMTTDLDRLATVVRRTSNAVLVTDADFRITWANAAFERQSGYTAEEAQGRRPDEFLHGPQTSPTAVQRLEAALQAGSAYRGEIVNRSKDGRDYWLDLDLQPLRDDSGALVGFMTIESDITELHNARESAEQASIFKSQFLANMSHEIRTPMNAILGMLKLLQNTALTPRQLDYASKTEGAARSLLGLLNDILDFSKVEAGKMTLDPRPFRIDGLLRDLSVILSANVGKKEIEVLFDIDPALPRALVGDDMRLQQVLINLGGNAIKFTATGEVVVRVRVRALHDGVAQIEFAVRDSGIGIAPENQKHIFSGFSQAEASTTRRYGGTGLGLAICQRLVGLMGSKLRLDSTVGVGSRFSFEVSLPVFDTVDESLGGEPPVPVRPEITGLRALIVDDNATAREVLASMVHSLGWQADLAASGAEAIALLQARAGTPFPYQAIFVDWQMPGMDGWETSVRIRELAGGSASQASAPVVVMVTAHGREMLAQRSTEEQALLNGFLVKPETASMLLDAVANARLGHADPALSQRPPAGGARRLQGLRLLVVEDNLNNQQVAQELLSQEGAEVRLASNGLEGVEAIEALAAVQGVQGAEPMFDVVLMDLQMPVMDGYTATAEIRTRLGHTTLPIIAMTANAMASDREACLAAGMNDHVGKPFDLTHLVATLLKHSKRTPEALPVTVQEAMSGQPGAATRAASAPAVPADQLALLVEQASSLGLDLEGALQRLGGNAGVYLRLVRSFLKDVAGMPDQLSEHLQQGWRLDAGRLLHTLKGLSATLGARALAEEAAQAEQWLREGANRAPDAVVSALRAVVASTSDSLTLIGQALEVAMRDEAAGRSAGSSGALGDDTPADAAGLRRTLTHLAALLQSADMQALEVHAALQREHGALLGDKLTALDAAMGELDFAAALVHCQALMQLHGE